MPIPGAVGSVTSRFPLRRTRRNSPLCHRVHCLLWALHAQAGRKTQFAVDSRLPAIGRAASKALLTFKPHHPGFFLVALIIDLIPKTHFYATLLHPLTTLHFCVCHCELSMSQTRHAFRNDTCLSLRGVRDEAIPSGVISSAAWQSPPMLPNPGHKRDCFALS